MKQKLFIVSCPSYCMEGLVEAEDAETACALAVYLVRKHPAYRQQPADLKFTAQEVAAA